MQSVCGKFFLVFWSILIISSSAVSQEKDLSKVDIYLHTFDVGDLIYSNFGHTALRVKDGNTGRDMIYNWGIFDFQDPLTFSLNYYKGNLIYKLGIYPTYRAKQQYAFEGRRIWEDKLNLNQQQKTRLLEKLTWNSRPENRDYAYDYFFDNCSTRPRDFIDYALSGALRESSEGKTSGKTFRQMVRDGYTFNPWMDVILEVGMNSRIDRDMDRWDGMFHPLLLRDELRKLDSQGASVIASSTLIMDGKILKPLSYDVFKLLAILLFLPLMVSLVIIQQDDWQKSRGEEGIPAVRKLAFRVFGLVGFLFFFCGGVFGILMPLNWWLSGHQDLHHNINMMLFLPLDFCLVALYGAVLIKGRALVFGASIYRIVKRYLALHLILTAGLAISWVLGDVSQNLERVIFMSPVMVLILAMTVNFSLKINDEG